eukprot:gene18330-21861_t
MGHVWRFGHLLLLLLLAAVPAPTTLAQRMPGTGNAGPSKRFGVGVLASRVAASIQDATVQDAARSLVKDLRSQQKNDNLSVFGVTSASTQSVAGVLYHIEVQVEKKDAATSEVVDTYQASVLDTNGNGMRIMHKKLISSQTREDAQKVLEEAKANDVPPEPVKKPPPPVKPEPPRLPNSGTQSSAKSAVIPEGAFDDLLESVEKPPRLVASKPIEKKSVQDPRPAASKPLPVEQPPKGMREKRISFAAKRLMSNSAGAENHLANNRAHHITQRTEL